MGFRVTATVFADAYKSVQTPDDIEVIINQEFDNPQKAMETARNVIFSMVRAARQQASIDEHTDTDTMVSFPLDLVGLGFTRPVQENRWHLYNTRPYFTPAQIREAQDKKQLVKDHPN